MVEKVTSYDAASSGSVMNEVQNVYNDFAQLETQYQEQAGAVNTGTSPKVEYEYEDGSANTIRPTTMTYPAGQVLENLYDDTDADNLSRIRTLNFDGDDVCRYTYLGLGTFITSDYLEPEVKLDYASGGGVNPYAGFDRFGRIIDLLWQSYASSTSSSSSSEDPPGLVHLQYTYDRASNRRSSANLIAMWYGKDYDELYEYDGMHRLNKFHRGRLVENGTVIESPTLQQGWRLDATDNWRNFIQNDQANPSQVLDQQRLSNRVNEITAIARTVGTNWVTPEYDRSGNMKVIPQPKDPTQSYRGTWDAWNRLVTLEEPDGQGDWQKLQGQEFDGLCRCLAHHNYVEGTINSSKYLYYTATWRVLEIHAGSTAELDRQFVWGIRYIDDLIIRLRSVDSILDERIYSFPDASWNIVATTRHNIGTASIFRLVYSPYGTSTVASESYAIVPSMDWEIRFGGYFHVETTSLYNVRYRTLHSELGNWISRDLLGVASGFSLYSYCSNSPYVYLDPAGLQELDLTGSENTKIADADFKYSAEVSGGKLRWAFLTDSKNNRVTAEFHYLPSKGKCPCKTITFLQAVLKSQYGDGTSVLSGRPGTPEHDTLLTFVVTPGTAHSIDRRPKPDKSPGKQTPFLGLDQSPMDASTLFSGSIPNNRTRQGSGLDLAAIRVPRTGQAGGEPYMAIMQDQLNINTESVRKLGYKGEFETCAFCYTTQEVLGCVTWGFSIPKGVGPITINRGTDQAKDVSLTASDPFKQAIAKYNQIANMAKDEYIVLTSPTSTGLGGNGALPSR